MGFWNRERLRLENIELVSENEEGIASVRLARCRHCGREIYRACRSWAHLDNNIVLCSPLQHEHLRAEPAPA